MEIYKKYLNDVLVANSQDPVVPADRHGRVGSLLSAYGYLLDMFYPGLDAVGRLRKKWDMLRRFYPDLPSREEAAAGRRAARRSNDRAAAENKKQFALKYLNKPVQLDLFG